MSLPIRDDISEIHFAECTLHDITAWTAGTTGLKHSQTTIS